MTKRPFRTRILINAAHRVEYLASRTIDALGAGTSEQPAVPVESDETDPNIRAVQKARIAATASGDTELAERLTEIEEQLRKQAEPAPAPTAPTDSVLPSYVGRLSADDGLENIRRRLLANTPRPRPTDRD